MWLNYINNSDGRRNNEGNKLRIYCIVKKHFTYKNYTFLFSWPPSYNIACGHQIQWSSWKLNIFRLVSEASILKANQFYENKNGFCSAEVLLHATKLQNFSLWNNFEESQWLELPAATHCIVVQLWCNTGSQMVIYAARKSYLSDPEDKIWWSIILLGNLDTPSTTAVLYTGACNPSCKFPA